MLGELDYLTADDAAALLGITPGVVRRACRDGRMPTARMLGRQWMIKRAGVLAYHASRKPAPRRPGQAV